MFGHPFSSILAPFWSPSGSFGSSFEGPILDPFFEPIFHGFGSKTVPKKDPAPPPPLKMGVENHMGPDWLSKPSKVSFGTPLGLLWPPFGLPLAPFWLLWLPFGLPFRSFALPLVPFWSRNPSGIYTPFRFSPNQGHVRTLPQAHDIYICRYIYIYIYTYIYIYIYTHMAVCQ